MPNDQQLINAFSNNDFTYIDVLIGRHEVGLFNLCLKLANSRPDAEELYQQTWLKAIQKSHTCTKSFKNWLYTVCMNTYRDAYRRSRRENEVIDSTLNDEIKNYMLENATENVSAEAEALKRMTSDILMSSIAMLPDKLRLPVILVYFEGQDYKETAQILKLPIGTVKSRLNSAKEKLRREMERA